MALVILGGLVTSTWVALGVLPALYLRLGAGGRDVVVIEETPSTQAVART